MVVEEVRRGDGETETSDAVETPKEPEGDGLARSRAVAPGVRIERTREGHAPIEAGDASVAGFVGLSPKGPLEGAHGVGSWAEFRDRFGGCVPGAHLPAAVRGFFSNGGRKAIVARVGPPGGTAIPADFLSDGRAPAGMEAVIRRDEASLIGAPDLPAALSAEAAAAVYRALIDRVESVGDRIVLVDPPRDVGEIPRWSAPLRSPHAVLYAPWLRIATEGGEATASAPPSGHLAGSYARVEREGGIHWPPANAPLFGVVDLDVPMDDAGAEKLVAAEVNPIRAYPGRGIRAFGARTLAGDPIHVRRLVHAVRKAIRDGTEWVVFEPQAARVRKAVVRSVTEFLTRLWRKGALAGGSPDDAFYVRCLPGTEAGDPERLVCEVGIAPVRSAEFIVIRIVQRYEGGLSPTEGEESNLAR